MMLSSNPGLLAVQADAVRHGGWLEPDTRVAGDQLRVGGGVMMLSSNLVSLPFKLMLFVMVDGWNLILGSLATSFGLGAG
ncbi:Flagellar biosynthetic protein FliP precursor [compost metagenome]